MLAPKNSEPFGITLKVIAGFFFTVMIGLIKHLNDSFPLGQIVFFRSFIALLPLVLFLIWTKEFPSGLRTNYPIKHIIRCVFGTLAMFFSFATLRFLPVAESTAIGYLSPVFLVGLAIIFLKEKVSLRRWLGVAFGLTGLLVITLPRFTAADDSTLIGIGLGLTSAICIAVAMLQVRQLAQMGENAGAIAFYFALTSSVMGLTATIYWGWLSPTMTQWLILLAIGLIGGVAQIFMTLSYKYADASALAPYEYLSILWAVIMGMLVFDEMPDTFFWIATPFILLGAIVAKPRKNKK